MTKPSCAFPQRLRELRTRRRINASALSELCGLSRNMIGQYERAERSPSLDALTAIADYFDVSIDFLLGR